MCVYLNTFPRCYIPVYRRYHFLVLNSHKLIPCVEVPEKYSTISSFQEAVTKSVQYFAMNLSEIQYNLNHNNE